MNINDNEDIEVHLGSNDDHGSRKSLIRQVAICSISWLTFLAMGITYGTPTVMLPQIQKEENSMITVTESMGALLKSVFGYAAIPWAFFLTYLTIVSGRRTPLVFVSITMMSGYILLYCSKTDTHILISEILQTCALGAINTVCIMVICECTAPKYRGLFLTMKSATVFWGIWISNAMGAYFHWRLIPLLGIACSLLISLIVFFPESPSWLACKGRFEECIKAHRWLRGTDEDSEQELEKIIKSQKEHLSKKHVETHASEYSVKEIWSTIKTGEFYKPILLAIVLSFMYHSSGKLVCVMYSIDIIKKITDSEEMAYKGMLILDGVSLLGMYIGSAVSKYVPRRMLLFTTTFVAIIFLFILSLYTYLIKLSIIIENKFVSVTLLALFSISISSGIILMATTLFGEIVSLKYRSVSMLTISVLFNLIYSLILQPTPYIFRYFDLHGAFFIYGVSLSIFTAICYKYLPETKDKTLLEIEEYFKDTSNTTSYNKDVNVILLSNTDVDMEVDK